MGIFNSLVYGTKSLVRVIRNRWKPSQEERDGYLEYVRSRPHHAGVPTMMLLAACFAALSVIVALIAN